MVHVSIHYFNMLKNQPVNYPASTVVSSYFIIFKIKLFTLFHLKFFKLILDLSEIPCFAIGMGFGKLKSSVFEIKDANTQFEIDFDQARRCCAILHGRPSECISDLHPSLRNLKLFLELQLLCTTSTFNYFF